MTTKFRPLNDQVLVKREENATKVGSIIIPDTAQEKNARGAVISVGRGKEDDHGRFVETTVKPGNKVLFGKYSGQEIKIDGEDYLIIREPEILGVLED